MGSIESNQSLVNQWGDHESGKDVKANRTDSILVIPKQKVELTEIGLVRPLQGSIDCVFEIFEHANGKSVVQEKFTITTCGYEKSFQQELREPVTLKANEDYVLKIRYKEGWPCYTYTNDVENDVSTRGNVKVLRKFKYDYGVYTEVKDVKMNLITELKFIGGSGDNMCC